VVARLASDKFLGLCLALIAPVAGCTPADEVAPAKAKGAVAGNARVIPGNDVEALRAEVARLTAENARLRLTPMALAAEVRAAVAMEDAQKAGKTLKELADRFPDSAELQPTTRRVEILVAKLRAQEEERKRVAALGFKALHTRPAFNWKDTELRVADSSFTRRWRFDSYGQGWRYLESEKGQRLLTAAVTVISKNKDPALFGMAAYVPDGPTLKHVGNFQYRFARWMDFGALLGNHADFRNDFGHTSQVTFTAGTSVPEDVIKRRPLYLVVTREGCHTRRHDRVLQPPVHYLPGDCASLKKQLTLDDFKDGSLAILKRID
jgi:hypothetical protein